MMTELSDTLMDSRDLNSSDDVFDIRRLAADFYDQNSEIALNYNTDFQSQSFIETKNKIVQQI